MGFVRLMTMKRCVSFKIPVRREKIRVSIQGVKSLCGDRVIFPRLGTKDTDRWHMNLCLRATCQCPWCLISEKQYDPPKVI